MLLVKIGAVYVLVPALFRSIWVWLYIQLISIINLLSLFQIVLMNNTIFSTAEGLAC